MKTDGLGTLVPFLSTVPAVGPGWDFEVVQALNGYERAWLQGLSRLFSDTETAVVIVVPLLLIAWAARSRRREWQRAALAVGLSVLAAFLIGYALKYGIGRPRPYELYPELLRPFSLERTPSFPSGHATSSMALAVALWLNYRRRWLTALSVGWSLCVCLSRVYEGVHYPTDVAAGIVLGAAVAWAVRRLLTHPGQSGRRAA